MWKDNFSLIQWSVYCISQLEPCQITPLTAIGKVGGWVGPSLQQRPRSKWGRCTLRAIEKIESYLKGRGFCSVSNWQTFTVFTLLNKSRDSCNYVALSWGRRGILDLIIPEGDKKNPEGPSRGLCPRDGPEGFFLDPEGWLKTWSRVWLLTMTFFTNSRPAVLQGDDNIHNHP